MKTAGPPRLTALAGSADLWLAPAWLVCFYLPALDVRFVRVGWIGVVLLAAAWGFSWKRTGSPWASSPLHLPAVLFLAGAVVGLLVSRTPLFSLARFWAVLGGFAVFDLLARPRRSPAAERIFALLAAGGVLAVLAVMTQVDSLQEYPRQGGLISPLEPLLNLLAGVPNIQPRPDSLWVFGRSGIAGGAMVFLPLLWGLPALTARRPLRLALWLCLSLPGSAFLLAVLTASAGFGAAASLAASSVLVLLIIRKPLPALLILVVLAFAGLALLSLPIGQEALLYMLSNLDIRLDLWQAAFKAIADFPATGLGLGMENWVASLPAYALPGLEIYYDEAGEQVLMHVHDFYLQTWLEQGLLGFMGLIALVHAAVRSGIRAVGALAGSRRTLLICSLWSFLALMIHCLAYAGPSSPAVLLLWLLAAFASACVFKDPTSPDAGGRRAKAVPASSWGWVSLLLAGSALAVAAVCVAAALVLAVLAGIACAEFCLLKHAGLKPAAE